MRESRDSFTRLAEWVDDDHPLPRNGDRNGERFGLAGGTGMGGVMGGLGRAQWNDPFEADVKALVNATLGGGRCGGRASGRGGRKGSGQGRSLASHQKHASLLALDFAAESIELNDSDIMDLAGIGGGHGRAPGAVPGAKGHKRAGGFSPPAGHHGAQHGAPWKRIRLQLCGANAYVATGKSGAQHGAGLAKGSSGAQHGASGKGTGGAQNGAPAKSAGRSVSSDYLGSTAAATLTTTLTMSNGCSSSSGGVGGKGHGGGGGGSKGGGGAAANGAGGGVGGVGGVGGAGLYAPERPPPKRRGWLTEKEEQEALSSVKFPPSAASARLLRQLADFNPSGKVDPAANVRARL